MAIFIFLSIPLREGITGLKVKSNLGLKNPEKDANLREGWVDTKCSQLPICNPLLCVDQTLHRLLSFLLAPELHLPSSLRKHLKALQVSPSISPPAKPGIHSLKCFVFPSFMPLGFLSWNPPLILRRGGSYPARGVGGGWLILRLG